MKNDSRKKFFTTGKKNNVTQLRAAFDHIQLRHDSPQFSKLCENYNYDIQTEQICNICNYGFPVSLSQIIRKINSSAHPQPVLCPNCSPSNINESTIIRVIEIALKTKMLRNTRPLKIYRIDYPEFFKKLKREWTSLEIDAIEIESDSNKNRKKLLIEIDGVSHFFNKIGLNRDSERTKMSDAIKNELIPKLYQDYIFVRVALSDSGDVFENLQRAYNALITSGIDISIDVWVGSIQKLEEINSSYRQKIITNIEKSGAKFNGDAPSVIQQSTILDLRCENNSAWPAFASIFSNTTAKCPCFYCSNRRPLLAIEIDDVAARAGVKVLTQKSHYRSGDDVQVSCLKCNTELTDTVKIRLVREKSRNNENFDCRYCNMNSAIPAIKMYFILQEVNKMTEKAAKEKVIADFGINPSSRLQSYRNDYRDDKLPEPCRLMLETELASKLDKAKQGNKFSDEKLVLFLEKLKREETLSEIEQLQTESATIKRFRKQKVEGTLDPKLEARLVKIGINLEPTKNFSTQERLFQLKAFVELNGRLPRDKEFKEKREAGDADAGLYDWQRDMFYKIKHGKLIDDDLVSELIAIRNKFKST